ncbi:SDR family NAD(P)-dependent oxidoreductase [Tardiphaga sp. 1201_B9_N1_1]|uniref:SDR family NAD(P)-dependent oxidoreductase n=1 Tax=unclassified Tardiphaga TaxID=2631404 RepID=UPI003F229D35
MTKSVAIVTGANQGIGRATAIRRLARDFITLVLVAHSRDKLEAVAEEIQKQRREVLVIEADLADPATPGKVVEEKQARFGRIDVLLNIAEGGPPDRPVRDDRRAVGRWPWTQAAWSAAADDGCLAGASYTARRDQLGNCDNDIHTNAFNRITDTAIDFPAVQ